MVSISAFFPMLLYQAQIECVQSTGRAGCGLLSPQWTQREPLCEIYEYRACMANKHVFNLQQMSRQNQDKKVSFESFALQAYFFSLGEAK